MMSAKQATRLTQIGRNTSPATHSLPYRQLSALVEVSALSGLNEAVVKRLKQPLARELGEHAKKAGYQVFLFTRTHTPEPLVDMKIAWPE